ncbi:feruloyl-CoA synthase [Phaeobacter sp. J2-8]|uniref:feruloyl-CoA synthase n=1 Tax=Phaeobacter sp. J2-8 TaxID=2931394 RepID=UPI001FD170DD|nr:feruloyl-CoA synthase [Phaeobacter sp. J2-8]MCJ7872981.1 feruloyl-CoA synthase [Phaeobacter sp. J2-8]
MKRTTNFRPHEVTHQVRDDGSILYRSAYDLGPVVARTGDWLHQWADATPDAIFIAERSGPGWREESYASTLEKVRGIASALLARGMDQTTPILIMSGNGVDHGLLALGAQYAGVPIVPVAEQYSLIAGAHGRLRHAVELVRPKMAYVVNAAQYGAALDMACFEGIEVVASQVADRPGVTDFDSLLRGDAGVDLEAAYAQVGPDTVAKILMTSGSTSAPKGVMTTHRMMCTNQTMLADSMPFLKDRRPVVVDWLPWNHVFGGSHNFNMMLANGGAYYVDDGKPVKGQFDRTLENLNLQTGTLSFNVPVGYAMLVKALEDDADLRRRFFADLDLMFYAGASLPQDVWQGLETMAYEVKGEVPLMTSSWGLTETAPSAMMQQEPTDRSGVVGVPLTGVTVKLIPDDDMRCEVRVKGANVMTSYFEAPEKTRDAFDDEGFFITGDAMKFVDPGDFSRGMRFDGRISEDFKLLTGTWVRAAQLRLDMLSGLLPLAADLVVTGADRNEIGVMIFPALAELERAGYGLSDKDGALNDAALLAEVHKRLTERAAQQSGSSTRVARAILVAEPASMPAGEMTAKGNLNFRKILERRKDLLDRLYADDDPAVVTL